MNLFLFALFLALCFANGLQIPLTVNKLQPRVIHSVLPKVYVYDHCPFCVRVRLALGLKNVKIETVFLSNDDVSTPTSLINKKAVPIFEWSSGGIPATPESMDIIKKLDADTRFGVPLFKPFTGRFDDWQKSSKEACSTAQRPRYMMSPTLPEFATADARDTFVRNHPISGIEKPAWQALESSKRWQLYADSFVLSLGQIDMISASLTELDKLLHCEHCATEGGLSLDDVDLWARLRSVTLIKGVVWPTKLKQYMENLSALGDVPLMWSLQQ